MEYTSRHYLSYAHHGERNQYASDMLLQILREVGLKHEVNDAETFIACARRVATSWADAAVSHEPAAAAAGAMKVRSLRLDSAVVDPFNIDESP